MCNCLRNERVRCDTESRRYLGQTNRNGDVGDVSAADLQYDLCAELIFESVVQVVCFRKLKNVTPHSNLADSG